MKKIFNQIMNLSIVSSILFILLGVFLYAKADIANQIIGYCLGTLILLMGVSSIMKHRVNKKKLKLFQFELVLGVISLVIGMSIILNPLSISMILTVGLGVWILILGTLKLNYALILKKFKEEYWSLYLAMSLIYIIFGALLIFNPFRATMLISEVIGLFVIAYGLLNLVETVLFKQNANAISKIVVIRK